MPLKDCLPATSDFVKKGEPSVDMWAAALDRAKDVFSLDFERVTLPTLNRFITVEDSHARSFHSRLLNEGLRFYPLKDEATKFQGFFHFLFPEGEPESCMPIAWGISRRHRKFVVVELVLNPGEDFWYDPREVEVAELLAISKINPLSVLRAMVTESANRVDNLETSLFSAKDVRDYLRSSLEVAKLVIPFVQQ